VSASDGNGIGNQNRVYPGPVQYNGESVMKLGKKIRASLCRGGPDDLGYAMREE